jgi:hypothetical protein
MKTKEHEFLGLTGYPEFERGQTYLLRYTEFVDGDVAIELDHVPPKQAPVRFDKPQFEEYFVAVLAD